MLALDLVRRDHDMLRLHHSLQAWENGGRYVMPQSHGSDAIASSPVEPWVHWLKPASAMEAP